MKRKLLIPALAAAVLLSGCGAMAGNGGDAVIGRSMIYTRAASDEEVFSHPSVMDEEDEDLVLHDESVPLSGLPTSVTAEEEETDEGWILVRYTKDESGIAVPVWYRVWTEEGRWSSQSVRYEGTGWYPAVP